MSNITIPPVALEAAKRAYQNCEDDDNCILAACLALIQRWPGMDTRPNIYGRQDAILILPLTENSNERE